MIQVVYLDSGLEVGDVRGVFDVLLKVGRDLCSPWRSHCSDKHEEEKNMNDAKRRGPWQKIPSADECQIRAHPPFCENH